MNVPTSPLTPIGPLLNHESRLVGLLDDALNQVAPFFGNNEDQHSSMRIYRAMEKLHDLYPQLNGGELEALLMGVFKHKSR